MNHLLLVEDDPAITNLLGLHLQAPDFRVTAVDRRAAALERLRSDRFDLIVLDILLPDGNGIELCRLIRQEKDWMPILVLSALADESDKVLALESGADDYLTKPFGVAELVARIRALLRRPPAGQPGPAGARSPDQMGAAGGMETTTGKEAAAMEASGAATTGAGKTEASAATTGVGKAEASAATTAAEKRKADAAKATIAEPAVTGPRPDAVIIEFRDLMVDRQKRKVTMRGQRLELTPKEFDLLWLLAGHPGKTFSRHELLERIWGFAFQEYEHTVTSHINRLRIKIEPDLNKPEYILTTWGAGYRFAE